MELVAKHAELKNGLRLSYAEQGANRGTPLILLHGIADSWRIFEPLLAELPENVHTALNCRTIRHLPKKPAEAMINFFQLAGSNIKTRQSPLQ